MSNFVHVAYTNPPKDLRPDEDLQCLGECKCCKVKIMAKTVKALVDRTVADLQEAIDENHLDANSRVERTRDWLNHVETGLQRFAMKTDRQGGKIAKLI